MDDLTAPLVGAVERCPPLALDQARPARVGVAVDHLHELSVVGLRPVAIHMEADRIAGMDAELVRISRQSHPSHRVFLLNRAGLRSRSCALIGYRVESRNSRSEPRPRTRPSCRPGASSPDGSARGNRRSPRIRRAASGRCRAGGLARCRTPCRRRTPRHAADTGAAGDAPLLLHLGADHHELALRRLSPHPQQHAVELEVLVNTAADSVVSPCVAQRSIEQPATPSWTRCTPCAHR